MFPLRCSLSGGLDIEVSELLTIYDGDPKFFCLGRIKQHALHSCTPALRLTGTATFGGPAQAPDGYYSDESVI